MEQRIAEAVDPQLDFAVRIVMDSDLSDLRYLVPPGMENMFLQMKQELQNL